MKKRIDHLQAENQTLKSDVDRQRATVNKIPNLSKNKNIPSE
jgi:hypothetical protein